jgi:tRNA U38,U39,U40 pseudouridine synthase TruA
LRVRTVRGRVLTRLQQIRTVARAIKRHLALLAAALRTDLPVHGRAKPLFFSLFTDRATQSSVPRLDYFTARFHHRNASK